MKSKEETVKASIAIVKWRAEFERVTAENKDLTNQLASKAEGWESHHSLIEKLEKDLRLARSTNQKVFDRTSSLQAELATANEIFSNSLEHYPKKSAEFNELQMTSDKHIVEKIEFNGTPKRSL